MRALDGDELRAHRIVARAAPAGQATACDRARTVGGGWPPQGAVSGDGVALPVLRTVGTLLVVQVQQTLAQRSERVGVSRRTDINVAGVCGRQATKAHVAAGRHHRVAHRQDGQPSGAADVAG
ncbi:hypothetical protein G6F60_014312 [Rhizopus arrhizus]|nr:hypothetical protein G6F60_014312 [Rhizopus arrhizus]